MLLSFLSMTNARNETTEEQLCVKVSYFPMKMIAEKEVNLPPSMDTVYRKHYMWPSSQRRPHKLC